MKKIIKKIKENNLDALIISDPDSIFYLTGVKIDPHERLLALVIAENETLIAPSMHESEITIINPPVKTHYFSDSDDFIDIIPKLIKNQKNVGVDKEFRAKFFIPCLEKLPSHNFILGSFIVDNMRMIKRVDEIEKMSISSLLNDKIIGELIDHLSKPESIGITELEAVDFLNSIMIKFDADGYAFDPGINFGNGTCEPHHIQDNTSLKIGDAVIIDIGFSKNGYCSDMTRSFIVTPNGLKTSWQTDDPNYSAYASLYNKIYSIVRDANLAGIEKVAPGVALSEVDAAARDLITNAGYGEYFLHRTGHNIGIAVHELPDVSSSSNAVCSIGMTFSIEPGIYLPASIVAVELEKITGKKYDSTNLSGLGVRVEDIIAVTADGCEVLNKYPKNV